MSRKNIQDLVFDDVHSARPVHQMTLLAGIYTISGGRGLGVLPRTVVGALGTAGGAYRFPRLGKVVPSGSNRFSWRKWEELRLFSLCLARGKLMFCSVV